MKEYRVPEAEGIRAAALVDGTIGTAEWAALLEAMTEYNRFSRMVEDQMFYACNALFYGQGAEGWKMPENARSSPLCWKSVSKH